MVLRLQSRCMSGVAGDPVWSSRFSHSPRTMRSVFYTGTLVFKSGSSRCDLFRLEYVSVYYHFGLQSGRSSVLVHTSIVVSTGWVPMVHVEILILIIWELSDRQRISAFLLPVYETLSVSLHSAFQTTVQQFYQEPHWVRFSHLEKQKEYIFHAAVCIKDNFAKSK